MSRVLNHLIARSLGAAQAFRPRTPSLFEPVQPSHVPAGPASHNLQPHERPLELEEADSAAVHGPMSPMTQQDFPPAHAHLRGRPREAHRRPGPDSQNSRSSLSDSLPVNDPPGEPAVLRHEQILFNDPPGEPVRTHEQVLLSDLREPARPLRTMRHIPGAENVERHSPVNAESSFQAIAAPPRPVVKKTVAAPFADGSDTVQGAAESAARQKPSAPFLPDLMEKNNPGAARFRSRTQALSARDFASRNAEPVVHVTIGRIEIRAEREAAAGRKSERAASPVMGLEEYLRRKNTRGRE